MTDNELVMIVSKMADEKDNSIVLAYIKMAKGIVRNRLYPYDESKTDIPMRYENNVVEIAVYLLNKRGAEGETAHSENGINRTYGGASVPDAMLLKIVPIVGVVK